MVNFNNYRQFGFTTISNTLISNYVNLGISDEEFILIMLLEAAAQAGNYLPSEDYLASQTNMSALAISTLLQNLIEKGMLELKQGRDQTGKISNSYSLNGLYHKMDEYLEKNYPLRSLEKSDKIVAEETNPLNKLVRQFEIEFGRLLSPIEREEIASWLQIDHYDPAVIELALKESILSQVYNFKYVDRILLNWQKMGLKTPTDVQTYLGEK
ncbi:DnaD domain protein [Lactobacillus psittaci]|uniref:DNA replication protein DnaD n=1 Tax=Lactobacillus psittaci DSM 15354 TaxID=1122152 RepID=A0A0R1SEN1_9LACO|nr:DnaD domain protein [Lactobacillus psittaci]KRL63627.1 DNA replication protein DnaD [Lactobacillus psittaci DSM 15354]